MNLSDLKIDQSWTLFLDRDGVINELIPGDYVRRPEELKMIPGSAQAVAKLSESFGRIVIVTNQQGIGKGLMSMNDLDLIHEKLLGEILLAGGRIDGIFTCPHLADAGCECRKPRPGLALQAKNKFPEIDFFRSLIAGDSASDIALGKSLGMKTVFVAKASQATEVPAGAGIVLSSLAEWAG